MSEWYLNDIYLNKIIYTVILKKILIVSENLSAFFLSRIKLVNERNNYARLISTNDNLLPLIGF